MPLVYSIDNGLLLRFNLSRPKISIAHGTGKRSSNHHCCVFFLHQTNFNKWMCSGTRISFDYCKTLWFLHWWLLWNVTCPDYHIIARYVEIEYYQQTAQGSGTDCSPIEEKRWRLVSGITFHVIRELAQCRFTYQLERDFVIHLHHSSPSGEQPIQVPESAK